MVATRELAPAGYRPLGEAGAADRNDAVIVGPVVSVNESQTGMVQASSQQRTGVGQDAVKVRRTRAVGDDLVEEAFGIVAGRAGVIEAMHRRVIVQTAKPVVRRETKTVVVVVPLHVADEIGRYAQEQRLQDRQCVTGVGYRSSMVWGRQRNQPQGAFSSLHSGKPASLHERSRDQAAQRVSDQNERPPSEAFGIRPAIARGNAQRQLTPKRLYRVGVG
ncbi:MAG: hypothetical protein SF182_07505 [Deltaproteobacteria bacterium]|nr:hypothetical protein [Deltaproteobacteria bacterium]